MILGDIRGRKAGLGTDELLRFLPLLRDFESHFEVKLVEDAGLCGTGVELDATALVSPPAGAEVVDIEGSFELRVSTLGILDPESIAAAGREMSLIAGPTLGVDTDWPLRLTVGFDILIRDAGVAGAFAG